LKRNKLNNLMRLALRAGGVPGGRFPFCELRPAAATSREAIAGEHRLFTLPSALTTYRERKLTAHHSITCQPRAC